jgi:penicillin-binding protein 2
MKVFRWLSLGVILSLLVGCGIKSGSLTGFGPSPTLPSPSVSITRPPDAQAAMQTFLEAWKNGDYAAMYALLSKVSQDSISEDDFTQRYKDSMSAMNLKDLDYEVLSALTNPNTSQVAYRVTFHTAIIGDLQRDMVAHLSLENGQWRIQWEDAMILPELAGGNRLMMDYSIPARGDIYDRYGQPIVTQADAYALGIVPGDINPKGEGTMLSEISQVTGLTTEEIQALYQDAAPDWYIPVGEVSADEAQRLLNYNFAGLTLTPYQSRFYFGDGVAPQAVGYTQFISTDNLEEYRRLGYSGSERVGMSGVEKWGESYLAGKHGGALYVVDSNGGIVTRLAQSDPQPADSIYLTIDSQFQEQVQKAIAGFRGAAVVLERDTGRVLAMASTPTFDPNAFDPANRNSQAMLTQLLSDTQQPLVNRATQGEYPLGSVFKIITFSAALESGLYLPQTTYSCQYDFTELVPYGGPVLHDWTWDHCQQRLQAGEECNTTGSQPSGLLTLPQGLMRSCNPFFWHIGLDLYNHDRQNDIANMARAFGLGQSTGIDQVAEATGNIPNPTDQVQATNEAIGQGNVQVTPLQVATFVAAVGNGGTLYRPQLVEKIQSVNGDSVSVFKPEARGTLPLRADNLKVLQDAMVSVVENTRGTAHYSLLGLSVPVAGKTGTAQSGADEPHAWFAGYTMANPEDSGLPNIAIAVILENQGEGADWAAPVFRRIVESYYSGSPQKLYPWEHNFGVPNTPTPLGGIPTKTPKPK